MFMVSDLRRCSVEGGVRHRQPVLPGTWCLRCERWTCDGAARRGQAERRQCGITLALAGPSLPHACAQFKLSLMLSRSTCSALHATGRIRAS